MSPHIPVTVPGAPPALAGWVYRGRWIPVCPGWSKIYAALWAANKELK